jgi:hypothetical protein
VRVGSTGTSLTYSVRFNDRTMVMNRTYFSFGENENICILRFYVALEACALVLLTCQIGRRKDGCAAPFLLLLARLVTFQAAMRKDPAGRAVKTMFVGSALLVGCPLPATATGPSSEPF